MNAPTKQSRATQFVAWLGLALRRWWPLLAVAFTLLICVVLTVRRWDWLTEDSNEVRIEVIRVSSLVAAGIVAMILAIWRSRIAERQLEIARGQFEIAGGQFEISQRSHHEGRYQNASEMLGSELLSVRLGAIHALDQLARDYPKEFHIQVMRLFGAFLRHPPDYPKTENGASEELSLREDFKVIAASIVERTPERRELAEKVDSYIDLRGADLGVPSHEVDPADFSGADLFKADLFGANLSHALFLYADLTEARLVNADLSGAIFINAILVRAKLSGADLTNADLTNADLRCAIGLTQSQLDRAKATSSFPPRLQGAKDWETKKPLMWPGARAPRPVRPASPRSGR